MSSNFKLRFVSKSILLSYMISPVSHNSFLYRVSLGLRTELPFHQMSSVLEHHVILEIPVPMNQAHLITCPFPVNDCEVHSHHFLTQHAVQHFCGISGLFILVCSCEPNLSIFSFLLFHQSLVLFEQLIIRTPCQTDI